MVFSLLAGGLALGSPIVPTCPCHLPKVVGPCRAAIPRFHFNSETGICEQFLYGGCGGNRNNYKTKLECDQACTNAPTCPCLLPKVVGPCRAAIPRFHFNSETGICKQFLYGGCRGNRNNYQTKLKCEQACTNVCALPIDSGTSCSPRPIGRFGYSQEQGHCVKFQYGGCGGNSNSFQTLDQCEQTCEN